MADLAGLSRESIAAYRRAREFVRDDPLALAALMTKEVALHQRVGQLTTALRIIAHARRLARDDSPRACRVRSQLTARLAFVSHVRAKHADALRWSALAVDEALRSEDTVALAFAYNVRDLTLTGAGQVGDRPYGELALARYEEAGDLLMQSRCINNLAIRAFLEGRWPLAQDRFALAAEVLHRVGDTANEGWARLQPGGDGYPPGPVRLRRRAARACGSVGPDRRRRRAPRADPPGDRQGAGRPGPGRGGAERLRRGARTAWRRRAWTTRSSRSSQDSRSASRSRATSTAPRRRWSRRWRPPKEWGHGSVLASLHCHLGAVRLRRGRPRRPPRRSKLGWPIPTPATVATRARSTGSAWTERRGGRRQLARARKPGPPWSRSASSCCPTGSTPSSPDLSSDHASQVAEEQDLEQQVPGVVALARHVVGAEVLGRPGSGP